MSLPSIRLKKRHCDPELLSQNIDLHPVLQRIFSARAIRSFDEINYPLSELISPQDITHLNEAAGLLADHVINHSNILVFGDYDADGATSTALCVRALNMLGCRKVSYCLPDRIKDGYGISISAVERILDSQPDLVISVDTGIASFKGLLKLAEANIDTLVTDHHLPADHLPSATAIVNPNAYPESVGKNLAGVGVAFYLMLALRSELRKRNWFTERPEPNLADCLDLVAIGTIADLVPLDFNNRILVHHGLNRIRAGACSSGITQLIRLCGRSQRTFSSQDIGFALAPRINAAGRLDDMSVGVQTLLADDASSAGTLAQELESINRFRRELQGQMTEQAMAMLPEVGDTNDRYSYVLYQPDWHEGIVGIIASKIKDITYRPSISFAPSDNGLLKGSCRSIPGVHMRDMLDLVDKKKPGLIERFGGHAMAAGLTIKREQLQNFSDSFDRVLQDHVESQHFDNVIECDGEIEDRFLNLELAQLIEQAGPWGQHFPHPSFEGKFQVLDQRVLGDRHLKFVLSTEAAQNSFDAILFYASETELKTNYQKLHLHYELSVNQYQGMENLQLIIRHIL